MNFKSYPQYKDSEIEWISEIPAHWNTKKAKYLFKEISDKGHADETLLSVAKGKGVIPREEMEARPVMAMKDLHNFKLVQENQFVIHLRSFQSGFELAKIRGIVSPAYTIFKCLNQCIPEYFKYVFYSTLFIDFIASTTLSLRDGKPVSYQNFSSMQMILPPKEEQIQIGNFLGFETSKIDDLIQKYQKLIELLNKKRLSVISNAVTNGLNPKVKMKNSTIKGIRKIPINWIEDKMKYNSSIRISNVDKKSKDNELDALLCNYIDVYKNEHINSKINFMKATASLEQFNKLELRKNDVIITKDSETAEDIAVPALVSENISGVVCGYHLALIRPNTEKIDGEYLFRALQSKQINDQFVSSANGVTRFGISTFPIKNSFILIPPLKEQKMICEYLSNSISNIDSIIEKLIKQISLLHRYKISIIDNAIIGKIEVRNIKIEMDELKQVAV